MQQAASIALNFGGNEWILDDLSENIDLQEDEKKVTQIRQHFTIQIRTQILCSAIPATGHIGKHCYSVPYRIGSLRAVKNAPANCVFLCVGDSITPLEHPGDYAIRRLVLESYGQFFLAPTQWNQ